MRGGNGYPVGVARVRRIGGDAVPGFWWPQRKSVVAAARLIPGSRSRGDTGSAVLAPRLRPQERCASVPRAARGRRRKSSRLLPIRLSRHRLEATRRGAALPAGGDPGRADRGVDHDAVRVDAGRTCTLPGMLRIAGRHGDAKNYKGRRSLRGSRGDVPVQEATEPADVEGSLTVTVTDRPRPEDVR